MSQAQRFNQDKPQYSLIDITALEPCARVLEFGVKKYTRNNWKKGMPVTSIIDSLLRHLGALLSGELIDPESGLPHIGHIQCNAMFLGNPNNTLDVNEEDDIAAMGIRPPKEEGGIVQLAPEAAKELLDASQEHLND